MLDIAGLHFISVAKRCKRHLRNLHGTTVFGPRHAILVVENHFSRHGVGWTADTQRRVPRIFSGRRCLLSRSQTQTDRHHAEWDPHYRVRLQHVSVCSQRFVDDLQYSTIRRTRCCSRDRPWMLRIQQRWKIKWSKYQEITALKCTYIHKADDSMKIRKTGCIEIE